MIEDYLLEEASKVAARTREEHLAEAKESYVRRVQVVVESWLPNALLCSTGPFDALYPELDAWAKARSLDVSLQMGELLALLMRKELLSGAPLPPVPVKQEQQPAGFMQVLKMVMGGQTVEVKVDQQVSIEGSEEVAEAEQPQENQENQEKNDDGSAGQPAI